MISQVLLGILIPGKSDAQAKHDSDWPNSVEVIAERTLDGNPLAKGDGVFGLRGSHRFVSGDLGLELGVFVAKPTSDFVRALGGDAKLAMLELSVVWYASYHEWYRKALASDPWHRNRAFKSELIVFGGPGWATLQINDAFPNYPLPNASTDYLAIHGGVGAKIHWLRTDPAQKLDHKTSRWYLRPEVRGRWFAGGSGEVDWTVGLSLGACFGTRPSSLALTLDAQETGREARELISNEIEPYYDTPQKGLRAADDLWEKAMGHRGALEDLRAHAVSCGRRCADVRGELDEVIGELNGALAKLRPGPD